MTHLSSRAPGQILVYCHPCLRGLHRCTLFAEPDRTPRPDATWLGLTGPARRHLPRQTRFRLDVTTRTPHNPAPSLRLVFPQAAPSITRAYFPVRTTGPPRFPQSRHCDVRYGGTHPCLLSPPSHPWDDIQLWMRQHPRVYRFSVRSRLTPSNGLTSWLSRQVPVRFFQAAFPLSRTALALHSSWISL